MSFYPVSRGYCGFSEFRSSNSVSHHQELVREWKGCLCLRVLSELNYDNFYHNLVFYFKILRNVDGFFEHSTFVVSECFGYTCRVEKAFHVAKLRDSVFAPQSFNSVWFYSHDSRKGAIYVVMCTQSLVGAIDC